MCLVLELDNGKVVSMGEGHFGAAVSAPPIQRSYKPKQRSYRKTNLKKKVLAPNGPGAEMSGAETARRRVVQRRIGGAESAAPKRRRRNGPPPKM